MTSPQLQTLQWQFDLTWRLAAEWHLAALTDEVCLWEPAPGCWTVRRSADGIWRPDWIEPEPSPAPPTTIGWLTWHLIWWWSGLLAAVENDTPVVRDQVAWLGGAKPTVERLEALSTSWAAVLSKLDDDDLEEPLAYPWPEPRPLRLALAWANSELMKNVAEIGVIRRLFEASHAGRRG